MNFWQILFFSVYIFSYYTHYIYIYTPHLKNTAFKGHNIVRPLPCTNFYNHWATQHLSTAVTFTGVTCTDAISVAWHPLNSHAFKWFQWCNIHWSNIHWSNLNDVTSIGATCIKAISVAPHWSYMYTLKWFQWHHTGVTCIRWSDFNGTTLELHVYAEVISKTQAKCTEVISMAIHPLEQPS